MKDKKEDSLVHNGNFLISFNTAKLLKDIGFAYGSNYHYMLSLTSQKDPDTGEYSGSFGWEEDEFTLQHDYFLNNSEYDSSNDKWYLCEAPSQYFVINWLRSKHDIWITLPIKDDIGEKDFYSIVENGIREAIKQLYPN